MYEEIDDDFNDAMVDIEYVVNDVMDSLDIGNERGLELIVNGELVNTVIRHGRRKTKDLIIELLREYAKHVDFKPGDIIIIQSFKVEKRLTLQ